MLTKSSTERGEAMQGMRQTAEKTSVASVLSLDHDRLDDLFGATQQAMAAGRFTDATSLFAQFRAGLERHIRIEEDLVFPAFERLARIQAEAGPTAVMRIEHRAIERLLEAVGEKLAQGRGASGEAAELQRVLAAHNMKEESVLYPMTDSLAGPDGARELVLAMELP